MAKKNKEKENEKRASAAGLKKLGISNADIALVLGLPIEVVEKLK